MKNFIACLGLASCILSAFPVNAEDMGYAAMIASDYYRWGIIFGVSDISTDFRYADKDEFGVSAECRYSSSVFENRVYYISDQEYTTIDLFLEAISKMFSDGNVPVVAVDGLRKR